MNDLVRRLSEGKHPIEASLRPSPTLQTLKAAIDRQYVHVRFTGTRGGTELGFKVDTQLSDLSTGDFETGTGTVKLCGSLVLDYQPVRCVAELDLSKLTGQGRLELLDGPEPVRGGMEDNNYGKQ